MRRKVDVPLALKKVNVRFLDGSTSLATAEGNNASWNCSCGELIIGRCYYQFGDFCYTECPTCNRLYRVLGDARKRAISIRQLRTRPTYYR